MKQDLLTSETAPVEPEPAGGTELYDLAVWSERSAISAAVARATYVDLAATASTPAAESAVQKFMAAFEACFLDVTHDELPNVPGATSAYVPALRCECFVFPAGVYLSFPSDLAPDITPVVCHLADQNNVVVYDRQRQAVFLPSAVAPSWKLRATAGDGFVVAHDPTAAELPAMLDAADQSNWFLILERDTDHYLQTAPEDLPSGAGARLWTVEYRDGDESTHHVSKGASIDEVKQAFVLYAVGGNSWKNGLSWSPLAP